MFTHRGLSGPAILQVSSYWRHGEPVAIDFLPDLPSGWLVETKRNEPRLTLRRLLARELPERLAETLADEIGLPSDVEGAVDAQLAVAVAIQREVGDADRLADALQERLQVLLGHPGFLQSRGGKGRRRGSRPG